MFDSSKFNNFLKFLESKRVLITTHNLVDLDGFASCVILNFFLKTYFKSNKIFTAFPEFSKSTLEFINNFSKKFPDFIFSQDNTTEESEIDIILVLDTNNINQVTIKNIKNFNQLNLPLIFIDHHLNLKTNCKNNLDSVNLVFDNFSSTAEIIFELCESFNVMLLPYHRFLLIAAILSDSGFFKYGNNSSIKRASQLLDDQVNFQEILLLLKKDVDVPQNLANIKGLQRARLIQEGSWLIGVTQVGSYEADVASAMTKIGFDIGIVAAKKKSELRITLRAKKKVCLKTGLHLGKILEEIAGEIHASGGGHDGAASMNCQKEDEGILDTIIQKIKQVLKNQSVL